MITVPVARERRGCSSRLAAGLSERLVVVVPTGLFYISLKRRSGTTKMSESNDCAGGAPEKAERHARLLEWQIGAAEDAGALAVYTALALHAMPNGEIPERFTPSLDRLGEITHKFRPAVADAIKRLERAGLVDVTRTFGKPHHYRLQITRPLERTRSVKRTRPAKRTGSGTFQRSGTCPAERTHTTETPDSQQVDTKCLPSVEASPLPLAPSASPSSPARATPSRGPQRKGANQRDLRTYVVLDRCLAEDFGGVIPGYALDDWRKPNAAPVDGLLRAGLDVEQILQARRDLSARWGKQVLMFAKVREAIADGTIRVTGAKLDDDDGFQVTEVAI